MGNDDADQELEPQPRWVKPVLRLAGLYNVLWGGWVVLFPLASLRACGYPETPVYPQLWQCIGMIVGVYGIGYWIAARDAFRHWPIVFVGLLGKVLGPIGFVWNAWTGALPVSAGIVNIFNDLVWWIPFGMILWLAVRHYQVTGTTTAGTVPSLSDALRLFRDQHGVSLAELSHGQRLLVIFLRHAGCTFCREAMTELAANRAEIESASVKIVVVHMESEDRAEQFFETYDLQDVSRIRDPEQVLYRAFGIGLGRFGQLLSLRVLWRGFLTAIVKRHGFAKVEGNALRMPGTFLIENGVILKSYPYRDPSDRPDYTEFACELPLGEDNSHPSQNVSDSISSSTGL